MKVYLHRLQTDFVTLEKLNSNLKCYYKCYYHIQAAILL